MNLDLSKFKKIEAGDKHTILEHPSGHQIKIAHKGLSDKLRKQLDEMPAHLAKGGYSKYAQKFDPNMASKASKISKSSTKMPGSPKEASNAYTEPNAIGTDIPKNLLQDELHDKQYPDVVVSALNRKAPPFGPLGSEPKQHYPPCINPSCKSFGKSHPNCLCYGGAGGSAGEAGRFAKGGEVDDSYFCSTDRSHKEGCEYFKVGGMTDEPVEMEDVHPNPSPVPPPQEESQMASGPVPEPVPSPINPNQEQASQSQDDNQQQTSQEAPQQQAPIPETPIQTFAGLKDQALNNLQTEAQGYENDLNAGHIKPETYHDLFAKKDTLGKIGTLFGLMLGGAGSGLSHQPNVLMGMMQNEIQNDLSAQQNSVTNKQNFLKINQQNLMNQAQVNQLNTDTKIKAWAQALTQMNLTAYHKLASDVQKLPVGSPQRQQAENQLAMLYMAVKDGNFNILDKAAGATAFQNMLFGPQNPQGQPQENGNESAFQRQTTGLKMLGPVGEARSHDIEEKHIPGFKGLASAPLNPSEKNELNKYVAFDQQVGRFTDWAKQHSGVLPTTPKNLAIINQGKTLARQLQSTYREAALNTVYRPGEQGLLSQTIPDDPTKFLNKWRVVPQLDALRNENMAQLNTIAKQKGFSGYQGSKSVAAPQSEIKTVNGVKYRRGPNGEAIEVK